jgi:hypothetical protein
MVSFSISRNGNKMPSPKTQSQMPEVPTLKLQNRCPLQPLLACHMI